MYPLHAYDWGFARHLLKTGLARIVLLKAE